MSSWQGKLTDLLTLKADWDSYGALPITQTAIDVATALIEKSRPTDRTTPMIVPAPHGGVQLEWHEIGYDLEIEVHADGALGYYLEWHMRNSEDFEEEVETATEAEALGAIFKATALLG